MRIPSRITEMFGIELPLLQAPMAGSSGVDLAVAVAEAGGLGAIPCAMLDADGVRAAVGMFRQRVRAPINLNFFVHAPPDHDSDRDSAWAARLAPYYDELGAKQPAPDGPSRAPFDAEACALIESLKPEIVSFHFGLPEPPLLTRVRATGAKIVSSATTVAEARWLEARGCDAIIAQGAEAGGHRGMFLSEDIATQVGAFALIPLIADAVRAPVIAAGAIADGRGAAAAFVLGASAVQVGTAFLLAPESAAAPLHRAALAAFGDGETALTNVFTGRPARGLVNRFVREVGPMSPDAPAFPLALARSFPLRAAAEAKGDSGFTALWSRQAAALAKAEPAGAIARRLMREAEALLGAGNASA